jgi:hypothetical protein
MRERDAMLRRGSEGSPRRPARCRLGQGSASFLVPSFQSRELYLGSSAALGRASTWPEHARTCVIVSGVCLGGIVPRAEG